MENSEATTIISTENRNLRALPFTPTEDQLSTGKMWEEWLEEIECELRYFRITKPQDMKYALIIYGGREIARLEKILPNPDDYKKLRQILKLNDYFLPKKEQSIGKIYVSKNKTNSRRNKCILCHKTS